jgi:hypothetical protein
MKRKTVPIAVRDGYPALSVTRKDRLGCGLGFLWDCGMIDWDRLQDLRDEIGDDDLSEVIAMFLDEADEVIARLSGGVPAERISAEMHFLKGSALNLGFTRLAELCQLAETTATGGETGPVVECYLTTRGAFLDGLKRSLAA